MENPSELLADSGDKSRDQFNNWIAVSVAILAAFMAVTKMKDDNIVQAMLQAKSDSVDTWSQYQATKIKDHLTEVARSEAEALSLSAAPETAKRLQEQIAGYDAKLHKSDPAHP